MTSSEKILPDEEEEEPRPPSSPDTEDEPPMTRSHRRRWSSPGESSLHRFAVESLAGNSDHDNGDCREHDQCVDLEGFFARSSERRYSFYLGPELTPWGPSAPPLDTESRPTTAAVERRKVRTETRKEDFPPFMTTLYSNGRPRFRLRRVRSEGRLEIARVAVEEPELVRVRGGDGVRIGTIRIISQEALEHEILGGFVNS